MDDIIIYKLFLIEYVALEDKRIEKDIQLPTYAAC